ncbi:hypothetical protein M271_50615 [Streptomyces rapamycinicus NRRL 5491]|nr:hypothetical protein M271_50615 [Streptomyces rapamycinicus NRRL 5491]
MWDDLRYRPSASHGFCRILIGDRDHESFVPVVDACCALVAQLPGKRRRLSRIGERCRRRLGGGQSGQREYSDSRRE